MSIEELYQLVRSNNVFYTRHAVQRMIERNITMEEVKQTVKNGSIIETENNKQYEKYLVCGKANGKYIHVVIKVTNIGAIITVYHPDYEKWTDNYTVRIRKENMP